MPLQVAANRADVPGGSTLGNLLGHQILIPMVDIGLAQLAMHSAMETAGADDTEYLERALKVFYEKTVCPDGDGSYRLL